MSISINFKFNGEHYELYIKTTTIFNGSYQVELKANLWKTSKNFAYDFSLPPYLLSWEKKQ